MNTPIEFRVAPEPLLLLKPIHATQSVKGDDDGAADSDSHFGTERGR